MLQSDLATPKAGTVKWPRLTIDWKARKIFLYGRQAGLASRPLSPSAFS